MLCELAFLDRHERLNVIGVIRHFRAPRVPLLVRRTMLVARLADVRQVDGFGVTVAVESPDGHVATPTGEDIRLEVAHEYIFVTFRDLPLPTAGTYRFRIRLMGQAPVFVDIPVMPEADDIQSVAH